MTSLRLHVGFLSDPGKARERNEDAFAVCLTYDGEERVGPLDAVFVVADGMGGHEGGDVASRFVADAIARSLTTGAPAVPDSSESHDGDLAEAISRWIATSVRAVDRGLRQHVRECGLEKNAGSTATVAAILGETLYLAQVGDSRGYRLRGGVLDQLTRDQSWIAEQVRAGLLTPEQAAVHPKRNMLTHCMGIGETPPIDVTAHSLEPGDRYLLSSDGLHGEVPGDVLARVLAEETKPQAAAERLVRLANEAGGPDNITALVFDVRLAATQAAVTQESPALVQETAESEVAALPDTPTPVTERRHVARRAALVMIAAGALAAAGAAVVGTWHYVRLDDRRVGVESADTSARAVQPPATADSPAAPLPADTSGNRPPVPSSTPEQE